MHRKWLIEIEMLFQLFFAEMVFKEIEALQYICLLDVAGTQYPVPTPFLVDWALAAVKVTYFYKLFIKKTVLL